MDRCKNNQSDESGDADLSNISGLSMTDSLREVITSTYLAATKFFTFTDQEMGKASPEVILRRMLSTKSAISTNSSLAEANQRARDEASQRTFLEIGKGQCGTVYALKGTDTVIKIPNQASKEDELYTDYKMHQIVYNAFESIGSVRPGIRIPRWDAWVDPKADVFWAPKAGLFPNTARVPNYGLLSERIFPVPLPVREAIVDTLCPKEIKKNKAEFLKKPENKDCLIRLYLGRRNDTRMMDPRRIRLRNFAFHVDEMERLGLDTKLYAVTMAETLALLHWKAGVDANDVEFVLGSSPAVGNRPTEQEVQEANKDTAHQLQQLDYEHRTVSMWLLDFNECKRFQYGQEGMKKLVDGFWINDPYYPLPNATVKQDKELWEVFMAQYLKVSAAIVSHEGPKEFIKAVIEKGNRRSGGSLFA